MKANLENLSKWIDELAGEIEQIKKKLGSGGSSVTITPALESGTKVADYTIGSTEGSLYAPTPPLETKLFLDTANASALTFVSEGQISYKAVADCAVKLNITVAPANTSVQVRIDNFVVWASQHTTESQVQVTVYLKAGQTVSTQGIGNSQYNGYSVIPLLGATAPVSETKKTKRK